MKIDDLNPTIPGQIALVPINAGRFKMLMGVALVTAVLIYWSLGSAILGGKLISIGMVCGMIVFFANRCRHDELIEKETLNAAREGHYLYCWLLNEGQMDQYRLQEKKRRQRRLFWCFVLPWIVGAVLAVGVAISNMVAGVSTSHCMKMGGAIFAVVSIGLGVPLLLNWLWRIPIRKILRQNVGVTLFFDGYIRTIDKIVAPSHWPLARRYRVDHRDDGVWLKLKFERIAYNKLRQYVDHFKCEIPIPEDCLHELEDIADVYAMTPEP